MNNKIKWIIGCIVTIVIILGCVFLGKHLFKQNEQPNQANNENNQFPDLQGSQNNNENWVCDVNEYGIYTGSSLSGTKLEFTNVKSTDNLDVYEMRNSFYIDENKTYVVVIQGEVKLSNKTGKNYIVDSSALIAYDDGSTDTFFKVNETKSKASSTCEYSFNATLVVSNRKIFSMYFEHSGATVDIKDLKYTMTVFELKK